jgi:hypothetical protein
MTSVGRRRAAAGSLGRSMVPGGRAVGPPAGSRLREPVRPMPPGERPVVHPLEVGGQRRVRQV